MPLMDGALHVTAKHAQHMAWKELNRMDCVNILNCTSDDLNNSSASNLTSQANLTEAVTLPAESNVTTASNLTSLANQTHDITHIAESNVTTASTLTGQVNQTHEVTHIAESNVSSQLARQPKESDPNQGGTRQPNLQLDFPTYRSLCSSLLLT